MSNDDHHVQVYKHFEDGQYGWKITVNGVTTARGAVGGYNNEKDCLVDLFGNFFGQYDESFLELYAKWQSYANQEYDVPPEAEPGIPVAVRKSGGYSGDLGDDPDGDASVDPRDT